MIDIWGADHHGYVPRSRLRCRHWVRIKSRLDVLLVQFAILYRGGQKAQMSRAPGEFITLRELRKEVGRDAARFFYVMRKCEQHGLRPGLAKSQSSDNPVYYVRYAHARIHAVLRQAAERPGRRRAQRRGMTNLECLVETHELDLLKSLSRYPGGRAAACNEEPHQLTTICVNSPTTSIPTNAHQFLVDDAALRDARIKLILATREVLRNGLNLLGVSAPEQM